MPAPLGAGWVTAAAAARRSAPPPLPSAVALDLWLALRRSLSCRCCEAWEQDYAARGRVTPPGARHGVGDSRRRRAHKLPPTTVAGGEWTSPNRAPFCRSARVGRPRARPGGGDLGGNVRGLFVRRRLGGAETCGLMPLTNCGAGRPHRPLQLFPFGGILRPTCRRSDYGRGESLAVAESRGRRFVLWHVLRVYAGQVLVRCKSHTTRPTTLSHGRPGAYLDGRRLAPPLVPGW